MNSSLNLASIEIPLAPSYWPLPMPMLALIMIAASLSLLAWYMHYKKQRPKRMALAELNTLVHTDGISGMEQVLRRYALTYHSRNEVAGLQGQAWLDWLDGQSKQPRFSSQSVYWNQALYANKPLTEQKWQELKAICHSWIAEFKPEAR